MALSEKTRLEMEAGAKHLAAKQAAPPLPPGYMEAMVRTHERHALLRKWENDGKITVEKTARLSVPVEKRPTTVWYTMWHVSNNGPTFTDIDAEQQGGSPSEVLVANIALALQAQGDL